MMIDGWWQVSWDQSVHYRWLAGTQTIWQLSVTAARAGSGSPPGSITAGKFWRVTELPELKPSVSVPVINHSRLSCWSLKGRFVRLSSLIRPSFLQAEYIHTVSRLIWGCFLIFSSFHLFTEHLVRNSESLVEFNYHHLHSNDRVYAGFLNAAKPAKFSWFTSFPPHGDEFA